jgi:peptide/nickel transport system substrate-binding protein
MVPGTLLNRIPIHSALPRRNTAVSSVPLHLSAFVAVLLFALACSPARPQEPGAGPAGSSGRAAPQKKTLTIAYGRAITHIGPMEGGVAEFREIAQAGLLILDPVSNRVLPRLAEEVPSTESGTLTFMPDGRLQTRFTLKPNLVWQDGTPFSAHDIALGYTVQADAGFPQRSSRTAGLVESMEVPDDRTLVITWSSQSRLALRAFTNTFWPMPRHIVGPLYTPGNLDPLINSPYWTRDFVGMGAYKVQRWVEGSQVEFAANDLYVMGRPKIDTIVWRLVTDSTAGLASVLAGDLDVTLSGLLEFDAALVAKDQWEAKGNGTVLMTPANWRWINLMPTNPFLGDIPVRRAMLHATDREAMSRDLFQGQQQVADIWVSPRRPQFSAVQAAITKYEYSPQRAEQLFQDAGWRKGADGILVNGRGERFVIDGRVAGAGELLQVQQATVDYWRRAGVQTDINNISPELDVSPEYRNQWTGAYWASINLVLEDLRNSLHSQLAPRPENRFAGSNRGRWMNPRADQLLDEMNMTLDETVWDRDLVEVAQLWTGELPHLPLYYINEVVTYGKSITGVGPRSETGSDNAVTWNIHEWDRA